MFALNHTFQSLQLCIDIILVYQVSYSSFPFTFKADQIFTTKTDRKAGITSFILLIMLLSFFKVRLISVVLIQRVGEWGRTGREGGWFNHLSTSSLKKDCLGRQVFQARIQPKIHRDAVLGSAPQAKIFEDRLVHPAISMNSKTKSFTYVILFINMKYRFFFTLFMINLTFNFLMMIG